MVSAQGVRRFIHQFVTAHLRQQPSTGGHPDDACGILREGAERAVFIRQGERLEPAVPHPLNRVCIDCREPDIPGGSG